MFTNSVFPSSTNEAGVQRPSGGSALAFDENNFAIKTRSSWDGLTKLQWPAGCGHGNSWPEKSLISFYFASLPLSDQRSLLTIDPSGHPLNKNKRPCRRHWPANEFLIFLAIKRVQTYIHIVVVVSVVAGSQAQNMSELQAPLRRPEVQASGSKVRHLL